MSAKGKIGRLPYAVRQDLNIRIRDGQQPQDILSWLNGLHEVKTALSGKAFGGRKAARIEVTPQNLSEYCRKGGPYEEWLLKQERVERIQTLAEFSFRMAEAAGGNVSKPAVSIAAGKMMEALEVATDEDVMNISKALTGLSMAETASLRAATDQQRLGIQEKTLHLEEAKFQRTTAELFLKFYQDKRAQEIAEGKGTKSVKIEELRKIMFGDITHERNVNQSA